MRSTRSGWAMLAFCEHPAIAKRAGVQRPGLAIHEVHVEVGVPHWCAAGSILLVPLDVLRYIMATIPTLAGPRQVPGAVGESCVPPEGRG